MAKKKQTNNDAEGQISDIRHTDAKRKNIPPANLAADGVVPLMGKVEYQYSPRRPPVLRFDVTGEADKLPELLQEAGKRPLQPEEIKLLAEALRNHEPWLEWAGKHESQAAGFTVDPVALHIHERISAQAILRIAARQDAQRELFADPKQDYQEAVQFYKHDIDWTNRLILGDSLQVMASLARREDLAGKVQMIYMDPPYGIKFGSNFQPEVGKRDVKDKETDLTREPEMVKAYRDTWHLGVHSYLSYLRDRLVVARELLADSGSIFVQISDENVHRLRSIMDEVFGSEHFCGEIAYVKTSGLTKSFLPDQFDIVLWYSRDVNKAKYHPVFRDKISEGGTATNYGWLLFTDGKRRGMTKEEKSGEKSIPPDSIIYKADNITSTPNPLIEFEHHGQVFSQRWKTNNSGLIRLGLADRLHKAERSLQYTRRIDDFPCIPITKLWNDTATGNFTDEKIYVVQSGTKAVARCLMMTTDPGDLVLDPTCGSGTTAYVAEQWGRRWITIDTSRVAVSIARQRLLTAKYDMFRLRDEKAGVAGNFRYKTVPHITLKSIAQNQNLDPIFAKHEPILEATLIACNAALGKLTADDRRRLEVKLRDKERNEGKRSVTDADRRRWLMPPENRDRSAEARKKSTVDLESRQWYHWEVPFDIDPDWPKDLQTAVTEYRKAWRAKMDEVNGCISANAEQEELVDQPEIIKNVVRVSGPFTVEAVQPPEMSLGDVIDTLSPIGGSPESLETFEPARTVRVVEQRNEFEVQNVNAYLDQMVRLLKIDGVRFPDNKEKKFTRLERIDDTSGLHAEGRWVNPGETDTDPEGDANVGVAFGPQYGPFTSAVLEKLIKPAGRRYDDLVIAAFSFSAEVYDVATNSAHPRLRIHVANIRPDVNPGMAGLLKEQPGSQLFTVFGMPRTKLIGPDTSGMYKVSMEGVDIYDPVRSVIVSTEDQKVAAWFLDGDYDGRTFCVTQAFFPDKTAWKKLSDALDGVIDEEAFEAMSGTVSLPFAPGKYRRVAIKVIDPRGNEVMQVHTLN